MYTIERFLNSITSGTYNNLTYFVINTILTVYFKRAYTYTVPGKRTSFIGLLINALQGPTVQYMGEEDRGDADKGNWTAGQPPGVDCFDFRNLPEGGKELRGDRSSQIKTFAI